jgi:hypothetical protein
MADYTLEIEALKEQVLARDIAIERALKTSMKMHLQLIEALELICVGISAIEGEVSGNPDAKRMRKFIREVLGNG